ncbi:MAG: hypothetical protein QXW70_04030 [Candidatus Anstonellales archaeon]
MKTPLCDLCGKTTVLCSKCKSNLKQGNITEMDIQVARLLYQINEHYNISEASFERAIDLGRTVLILTRGEMGLLIGKDGKVVSELSKFLGKKVRIAEFSGDLKKTIADVLYPVKLIGINTIYSGGNEIYKVRIQKSRLAELPMDLVALENILKSLLKNEVRISLE